MLGEQIECIGIGPVLAVRQHEQGDSGLATQGSKKKWPFDRGMDGWMDGKITL